MTDTPLTDEELAAIEKFSAINCDDLPGPWYGLAVSREHVRRMVAEVRSLRAKNAELKAALENARDIIAKEVGENL